MIPGSLTVRVIGTPVGLTFAAAVIVTLPVDKVNSFLVTLTLAAAVTVTAPTPKVNGKTCWIKLDKDGYPESLTPHCWGYTPGNGRYNKGSTTEQAFRRNYPCGGQWGFGCRKLIEKLK